MEIKHRVQLVDLMRHFNLPLTAAAIGVAEGLFDRDLLNEGLEKLYSIDAWKQLGQSGDGGNEQGWHDKNYNDAVERLKPFGEKSIILRGLSVEMAKEIPNNSLGLGYVDCFHAYEGVRADIEAYYHKLVAGGIMAFHDYENEAYGVKQAVEEFAKYNALSIHLIPENKKEDAGAFFRKGMAKL